MASESNFEDIMRGAITVNPKATLDQVVKLMKDEDRLENILKSGKQVKILITGQTGVGKSTLVNGLIGREVAEINLGLSLTGVTQKVTPYDRKADDLDVVVYDSPGLQDGSGCDEKYLEMLYSKCKEVNLIIFAIRMGNRFVPGNPDEQAMVKFTQKFGTQVWNKTVVVITCANMAEILNPGIKKKSDIEKKKIFTEMMDAYKKAVRKTLLKAKVDVKIVDSVKVIPAGYETEPTLLDGSLWFSNFWIVCLNTISSLEACAFLVKANASRLRRKESVQESDFDKPLSQQPIVLPEVPERLKESLKGIRSVATVVLPAIFGAGLGAVGLLGGPAGAVGIPVGIFIGMMIGSALAARSNE